MRLGLLLVLEFALVVVLLVGVAAVVTPRVAPQPASPTPIEANASLQSCPRQIAGCR